MVYSSLLAVHDPRLTSASTLLPDVLESATQSTGDEISLPRPLKRLPGWDALFVFWIGAAAATKPDFGFPNSYSAATTWNLFSPSVEQKLGRLAETIEELESESPNWLESRIRHLSGNAFRRDIKPLDRWKNYTQHSRLYRNPPAESVDQGVIVNRAYFQAIHEYLPAIVVTPRCDFAQNKVELVQLCGVFPAPDVIRGLLEGEWQSSRFSNEHGEILQRSAINEKHLSDLEGKIREIARQRFPRYQWLAPWSADAQPAIADFQVLTSATLEEVSRLEIIASLDSPFREQLPARYAMYMLRIGTPDFSAEMLAAWSRTVITAVFPPQ